MRHPMSPSDSLRLLRECGWGVLAVAEESDQGARPVAVPVAYALEGEWLYLTMTEGRKVRALRANPRLCLTVADVASLARWRSVAVIGRAAWLTGEAERAAAIAAFAAADRPAGFTLDADDLARFAGAELVRVEVDELHGWESGG
jgi:nitroimidazol reductase NimA-like FMN-containing flavoprotein (pyridoxamine 5'-phosphate oxidase superfamily)